MKDGDSTGYNKEELLLHEPATIINIIPLWGRIHRVTIIYEDGSSYTLNTFMTDGEFEVGDQVCITPGKSDSPPPPRSRELILSTRIQKPS